MKVMNDNYQNQNTLECCFTCLFFKQDYELSLCKDENKEYHWWENLTPIGKCDHFVHKEMKL